jgi:hypothetical protein
LQVVPRPNSRSKRSSKSLWTRLKLKKKKMRLELETLSANPTCPKPMFETTNKRTSVWESRKK